MCRMTIVIHICNYLCACIRASIFCNCIYECLVLSSRDIDCMEKRFNVVIYMCTCSPSSDL